MSIEKDIRVLMRVMVRRDLPEVLCIEELSFEDPDNEACFWQELRSRGCSGMVAEYDEQIVGYAVFHREEEGRVRLSKIAVLPEFRRKSVGRQMLSRLKEHLRGAGRDGLDTDVHETNLPAQLFFRSCGLKATEIRHNLDGDTYAMSWNARSAAPVR